MSLNPLLQGIQSGAQIGDTIQTARYNRMLAPLLEQQDFAGAARVAGQRGRADDALAFTQAGQKRQQQLSEQQRAQAQQEFDQVKSNYQAVGNLYQALSSRPEAERPQIVARVVPELRRQGVQIDLSQITPEMLSDAEMPKWGAQLQALGVQLDREGELYGFDKLGGTLFSLNRRTGEAVPVFTLPQQIDVPEGYRLTPDGNLEFIPGGSADPEQVERIYRAKGSSAPAINVYTGGQLTTSNVSGAQEAIQMESGILQRLLDVERQFYEGAREFLGLAGRAETIVTGALDWVTPGLVSPRGRERLAQASKFQSTVMRNFNETLRAMSGAAVTQSEYDRIRAQMPSIDDSPTVFAGKLDASLRLARAAITRQQFFLQQGIPFSEAAAANEPLEKFLQQATGTQSLGMPSGQGAAQPRSGATLRFNPRTGEIE